MRQVYNSSSTVTWLTGDSGYVFSEKIDPGYILHVHNCFAFAPERHANDHVRIGIRNGGQDTMIQCQAPLAAQLGAAAPCDFFIGEGDQVYGYFSDARNNDSLGIHLNGVLIPLSEWAKEAE